MVVSVRPLASSLFFVTSIIMIAACSNAAPQDNSERSKLTKRVAELQELLKKEDEKLAKKKGAIEAEFAKLSDETALTSMSAKIDAVIMSLRDGLKAEVNDEARAALSKQVRSILTEVFGANVGGILEPELTGDAADKVRAGEPIRAIQAFKSSMDYHFEKQTFETAWESAIKPELSKSMKKLSEELAAVQRQLEDLARAENAKRAGIPAGMIMIKGGTHRIGIDDKELKSIAERLGYSKQLDNIALQWRSTPSHEEKLDDFYIDQNEFTCEWYEAFLKENPKVKPPKHWKDRKYPEGFRNRPVTGVSFLEAKACAQWMGRRIPTEQEWEAAARFSDNPKKESRIWPWGNEWDFKEPFCNCDAAMNSKARREAPEGLPPMLDVGSFPKGRSFAGLNDMAGNAFEWTSSPFAPYKGFKDATINGRNCTNGDFIDAQLTLRGGDALKRDVIVSTFSRLGLEPAGKSDLVGFRTVLSAVRGLDHLNLLQDEVDLSTWVLSYPPLASDVLAGRKNAAIASTTPSGYSSVMSGGWDPATNVPCAAKFITIASRAADDFRDVVAMKNAARECKDQILFLGYLHLDVPSVEPALEAGDYFVCWQNAHPDVPPAAETAAAPKGKDGKEIKDGKVGKEPKPSPKAVTTGPAKIIPDAFIIQRKGKGAVPGIRVENFMQPVVVENQPTKLNLNASSETVEIIYALPIKAQKNKAFVVSLRLKLADGTVSQFR